MWASLWLAHLKDWVKGWVLESVFSTGNAVPSVKARFSTALDLEEVLSGARDGKLHVLVADVIKSFDKADWLCAWPSWSASPVQEGLRRLSFSG